MKLRTLTLALILFGTVLIGFAQVGEAASYRPPAALVVLAENTTNYPSPTGSFSTVFNYTWVLSPDDPDQVNGSFNYTIYINSTSTVPNGCVAGVCTGWVGANITKGPGGLGQVGKYAPVPLHPGWVGALLVTSGPQQPGNVYQYAYNVTAWNGAISTSEESFASCTVNLTANVNGSQSQCATDPSRILNGTQGLSAITTQLGTGTGTSPATANTIVELRWNTSLDDPLNLTTGNLSYQWFEGLPDIGLGAFNVRNATDENDTNDANGIRYHRFVIAAGTTGVSFQVRTDDPLTHQRSALSCIATVDPRSIYASGACGTMGGTNGVPAQGSASFPLLDVPAFTAATGFPASAVTWLLSGVLLFAIIIGAFRVAGPVAAVVGAGLGVCAVYALNLLPAWWLILAFMAAATVFVFAFTKGESSS